MNEKAEKLMVGSNDWLLPQWDLIRHWPFIRVCERHVTHSTFHDRGFIFAPY